MTQSIARWFPIIGLIIGAIAGFVVSLVDVRQDILLYSLGFLFGVLSSPFIYFIIKRCGLNMYRVQTIWIVGCGLSWLGAYFLGFTILNIDSDLENFLFLIASVIGSTILYLTVCFILKKMSFIFFLSFIVFPFIAVGVISFFDLDDGLLLPHMLWESITLFLVASYIGYYKECSQKGLS